MTKYIDVTVRVPIHDSIEVTQEEIAEAESYVDCQVEAAEYYDCDHLISDSLAVVRGASTTGDKE